MHKSRNRRTGGDLTLPTVEELLREQNETDFYEEEQFTSVPGYQTSEYKDSQIIIISNKEIGNLDQQISVSGESNSQYIMFEVNRFEDNIDLIDKLIQVHYEREDGVGDNCPVVDVSASNASDSKEAAAESESKAQEYSDSAKSYYEKTKTLSILNVGEMEFSINESKKCLSITYTQEGE